MGHHEKCLDCTFIPINRDFRDDKGVHFIQRLREELTVDTVEVTFIEVVPTKELLKDVLSETTIEEITIFTSRGRPTMIIQPHRVSLVILEGLK